MTQEEKFRLCVDSGALSRSGKPRPADLDGAWLMGTPGPCSRVPVRSATHGAIVGDPDLSKGSELARLGLLELVADVVVDVHTAGDPRVAEGGTILLGGVR
jgi:hypothetical protein